MPEKNYTSLEERTAKVEGILEQMDKRLDRVEVGIIDLKNEIKSDMERLETGLRADIGKLETGLRADMGKLETGLRADMGKLETSLRGDMEKLETGLRGDMQKLETRLSADISTGNHRIDTLEARIEKLGIKVDSQFKWLVGIVVGMWITTISSVLSMFFYIIFKG